MLDILDPDMWPKLRPSILVTNDGLAPCNLYASPLKGTSNDRSKNPPEGLR
ncbi:hypothetical protein [Sagittula sp. P11]|uniref:hypothetical protein n=1 Tax=Sagittula sp. P11 TaxID=2009329 RepID=UPI0012FE4878|nr:hypothetical protein [Sagittula sp. P11]